MSQNSCELIHIQQKTGELQQRHFFESDIMKKSSPIDLEFTFATVKNKILSVVLQCGKNQTKQPLVKKSSSANLLLYSLVPNKRVYSFSKFSIQLVYQAIFSGIPLIVSLLTKNLQPFSSALLVYQAYLLEKFT